MARSRERENLWGQRMGLILFAVLRFLPAGIVGTIEKRIAGAE